MRNSETKTNVHFPMPIETKDIDAPLPRSHWKLGPQQELVLFHLVHNKTDPEIADELNISPYTVKVHIRNMLWKTNTHSRFELAILSGIKRDMTIAGQVRFDRPTHFNRLTQKDVETLHILGKLLPDQEAAKELGIQYEIFRSRVTSLYRKVGAKTRTGILIAYFETPKKEIKPTSAIISRAEGEVLEQIAKRKSYAAIARALEIEEQTVRQHVSNMCEKASVHSRNELILFHDIAAEKPLEPGARLNAAEIEITKFVSAGMKNKEIANILDTTESAIKAHVGRITKKLGVKTRTDIILSWKQIAQETGERLRSEKEVRMPETVSHKAPSSIAALVI